MAGRHAEALKCAKLYQQQFPSVRAARLLARTFNHRCSQMDEFADLIKALDKLVKKDEEKKARRESKQRGRIKARSSVFSAHAHQCDGSLAARGEAPPEDDFADSEPSERKGDCLCCSRCQLF
jgi:hypothetical protein